MSRRCSPTRRMSAFRDLGRCQPSGVRVRRKSPATRACKGMARRASQWDGGGGPAVAKPVGVRSSRQQSARFRAAGIGHRCVAAGGSMATAGAGLDSAANGSPLGSARPCNAVCRRARQPRSRRTPRGIGHRTRPHAVLCGRGLRSFPGFDVARPSEVLRLFEGEHVRFEETETLGHCLGRRHRPRWLHGGARARGGLDLHLRSAVADEDTGRGGAGVLRAPARSQLVAEHGDGMAETMGRHDVLNKGKVQFGSTRRCATVGCDCGHRLKRSIQRAR